MDQNTTIISITMLTIIPLCLCYRYWNSKKDQEIKYLGEQTQIPILAKPFLALP